MSTLPQICIHRVDNYISKQQIFETFRSLKIGFIEKIIEIPLRHDDTGKRVIVKFKTWVENDVSKRILQRFALKKDIKIMYDYPWYWVAHDATILQAADHTEPNNHCIPVPRTL